MKPKPTPARSWPSVTRRDSIATWWSFGHSFGGVMAVKATNLYADRFGALVLVDSGIRDPDEPVSGQPMMGGGRPKVYPDRESAENRFRLYPPAAVREPLHHGVHRQAFAVAG